MVFNSKHYISVTSASNCFLKSEDGMGFVTISSTFLQVGKKSCNKSYRYICPKNYTLVNQCKFMIISITLEIKFYTFVFSLTITTFRITISAVMVTLITLQNIFSTSMITFSTLTITYSYLHNKPPLGLFEAKQVLFNWVQSYLKQLPCPFRIKCSKILQRAFK